MEFTVVEGDVSAQTADALVNAAGTSFRMGSGVAGALRRADRLGCESLAIPALGCGVAGFDLAEGATLVGEAIDAYDPETLATVRFVGYGEEAETIRRAVEPSR
ncbi:macro domain-containing protein [Halomarina salina]|uniref:Macro domain-containing protein n=1 Tax=Halomarina salina TaxID=1872699 RepID=A0ABD5RPS9_9EURY|nr:hypothetical protein [Halomarina salina]